MLTAIDIQLSAPLNREAHGGILLRVKAVEGDTVALHIGSKHQIVSLLHGMVKAHIVIGVHFFHRNGWKRFCVCLLRLQSPSAAMDGGVSRAEQYISAQRTDIES